MALGGRQRQQIGQSQCRQRAETSACHREAGRHSPKLRGWSRASAQDPKRKPGKAACPQIGFPIGIVHQKRLGLGIPSHHQAPMAAAAWCGTGLVSPGWRGLAPALPHRCCRQSAAPAGGKAHALALAGGAVALAVIGNGQLDRLGGSRSQSESDEIPKGSGVTPASINACALAGRRTLWRCSLTHAMDSRRLVVWISTGILGFQGVTLAFGLFNCSAKLTPRLGDWPVVGSRDRHQTLRSTSRMVERVEVKRVEQANTKRSEGHLEKSRKTLTLSLFRLQYDHIHASKKWAKEAFGMSTKESPSSRTKSLFPGDYRIQSRGNHSAAPARNWAFIRP